MSKKIQCKVFSVIEAYDQIKYFLDTISTSPDPIFVKIVDQSGDLSHGCIQQLHLFQIKLGKEEG